MHPVFLVRLAFDFIAAGLLLIGLSYWWLGNTVHELAGTAMFLLVILHNAFNRRRYGAISRTRREVREVVSKLETDVCPFVNLPEKKGRLYALTAEEMKNCRWIRPELLAQIEFAEWTRDNHLRHSKFAGLRYDKEPREVGKEFA